MVKRVLIVGAGGHGQVVADCLLQMAAVGEPLRPIGYLDDNAALLGQQLLGLPVLGRLGDLGSFEHDAVIVAVGSNRVRQTIFMALQAQGEQFVTAIHPQTVIAPSAIIGIGSQLCAGVIINPGAQIGVNTILNTGATIDHHNQIGAHVHVAPGVHLGGDVTIGEGTLVGIGSVVMPQRSVGAWSTVGAGSLVTRSLPDRVVALGAPARITRRES
ncbi:acetyltransferase [Candidatus Chloroploca sp. Khr17]|uniref:acetyltransferase n=1 Tax=Candidatus Chloroploca sp. Khr17 TaxID=2496869 RepID=UPI00101CC069|nr:acetyltransferase [Candidatus Chloroploca sp. Khr17]